jgi:prevent-host-death family protein
MGQWQTAEAKQRFSELVEAAASAGPQVVLRHKEPVAVVLSPDDYRRLVRRSPLTPGTRTGMMIRFSAPLPS